ncbi:afadin-like [Pollicipes pollicipes]|uniref:afadin-like n=1 Tax=Pollicipes pollicipes TaxID=41117 RepID=UPI0018858BDA|nr:afadin-like [Pollicipes pollicipes]
MDTLCLTGCCAGDDNFKRKLSRREKKLLKKQDKLRRMQSNNENDPSVAEKLYSELPETSFTRSISNPEAVMRRRRQQKLEKKLHQFRSRDGGPDTGGTLKIYGESLCSEVPYKTLLLSVTDAAAAVVAEMLEKYGKHGEDPAQYALVQVVTQEPQPETAEYRRPTGPFKEYVLDDDECPLAILMNHPPMRGSIMFHVRRRSADYQPRKRKKKPAQPTNLSDVDHSYRGHDEASLPFLVELNTDGTNIRHTAPRRLSLHLNVTEVGSERSPQAAGQCLQLTGHNVHPRHCVIAHTEGIVTVTPCGREAEIYVNGQRVYETTILQHGSVVQFGRVYKFRFLDPAQEERLRGRRESLRGHESYMERSTTYASYGRGSDPILPAVLEFREETEDAFFCAPSSPSWTPSSLQFKLAPTYTLYMSARCPNMVHDVIESRRLNANALAFWMANASEYLHFLKQDRHVSPYSQLAQDILAEAVQAAFRYLVDSVQAELVSSISLFLEDRDDANEEEGTTAEVLSILGNTMALLRRCRVNAALTIQLFSQLFHYINMSVFNRIVSSGPVNYCSSTPRLFQESAMEPDLGRQRDHLSNVIAQWNANRLDLFELSEPNEQLEFHVLLPGLGQKVCTKCIRVSSTATAGDVIVALAESFVRHAHALSTPRFAVYEIHEVARSVSWQWDERPLYVQLNWNKDDREDASSSETWTKNLGETALRYGQRCA